MTFNHENLSLSLDPDENHYHECYDIDSTEINHYLSTSDFKSRFCLKNEGLTLVNYNIRSFKHNFSNFISIFDTYESTPEILVFTETWFSSESILEIPNFFDYHTVRESRSG